MRNRRAICFFLLLSGLFLGALMMLSPRHQQRGEGVKALSGLPVDRVNRIEILRISRRGDRERVCIARTGGGWRIDSPISAAADEASVKRLLDVLAFSDRGSSLSAKDMEKMGRSLWDFALSVPDVKLTLSAGRDGESFSFGREVPGGNEYYAMRCGDSGVFTVPSAVVKELLRPMGDFRRRSLFTISPDDVRGMGLKIAGDAFTKVAKHGGSWRLTEPADAPADGKAVDAMVQALCSARIVSYTDAAPGTGRGLNEEEGCEVSLRGSLGELEKVLFGFSAGTGMVWAVTAEGAVVQVDASLKELCLSGRKTIEDTRMFPVNEESVTMISVSEGFPAYVIVRANADAPWRMVSPVDAPADQTEAGRLLVNALSVRGGDVVDSSDGQVVSIAVGTAATNFPACSVAAASLPGGFRFQDLRDRTVIRYPRAKIKKITVRTAAGAEWDSSGSEDLLNAIDSGITAKSVVAVSPGSEESLVYGFQEPSYTVTIALEDEASAMRRLLIGSLAAENGRYVAVGGSDAVFALSAEMISTLTRPAEKLKETKP